MSLSLEVKKFVNSENIGAFVTVTLPGELPVDDAEIRAVQRDKAAAEKASREAQALADAERLAERGVESAKRELDTAVEELAKIESSIEQTQQKYNALLIPHSEKKKAFESARAVYDEKRSASDALENEFSSSSLTFSRAERAHEDAVKKLEECTSELEKAKKELDDAEREQQQTVKQLDALKAELASITVLAEKAQGDVSEFKKQQSEQEKAFDAIVEESLRLSVEKRMHEKQFNEATQAENRAAKSCQRAKNDHLAMLQQHEALKARNQEKDIAKLAQIKTRLEAVIKDEEARTLDLEKAKKATLEAKAALEECNRRVMENAEKKRAAKELLDMAKTSTKSMSEAELSESSKLAGKKTDQNALEKALERIKASLAEKKLAFETATERKATAEEVLASAKKALDDALGAKELNKKRYDAAFEITKTSEKEADEKKKEFDKDDAVVDATKLTLDNFKRDKDAKSDRIKSLESALAAANTALSNAKKNRLSASDKAQDLHGSIHVIKTQYEHARMHYIESGKGETIILIHTAAQSLYTFRNVFYKLARFYHVIALDLVGHGYSDRPDFFDYTAGAHAESILGFMNELGIEKAHLLGFSMGAGYALELAKRHGDRVGSVIALSPGGVTGSMPLMIRMVESGLFGSIASKLYKIKTVEKLLDECLFDHTVVGPYEVDQYYRPACDPQGRKAIRRTVSGYNERELLKSIEGLDTPVLIACGEEDRWHSFEDGKLYESALSNAVFAPVRNAGHLLHEEKPDKIVDLVRSLIPAGYGDDE